MFNLIGACVEVTFEVRYNMRSIQDHRLHLKHIYLSIQLFSQT
jgi:hypothetical protein